MAFDNNKSALAPFGQTQGGHASISDNEFFNQYQELFVKYYIGISNLKAKGVLVDQGLPWRIERELTLNGSCLVIEINTGNGHRKLLIGRPTGQALRNLEGKLIKVSFILIDEQTQSLYNIRLNEKRELIVYNSQGEVDLLLNPAKIVYFINNYSASPDQQGILFFLKRMKKRLDYIEYDAKRSRKKLGIFSSRAFGTDTWKEVKDGFDGDDFAVNISPKEGEEFDAHNSRSIILQPANTKEREQLWMDFREYKRELALCHGIILTSNSKEERQNIPETLMLEAPYKAWEKERKYVREESYRQCEEFDWIESHWELEYGAQTETNEQKIKSIEEEIKIFKLEEELELIRKNRSSQKITDLVENRELQTIFKKWKK